MRDRLLPVGLELGERRWRGLVPTDGRGDHVVDGLTQLVRARQRRDRGARLGRAELPQLGEHDLVERTGQRRPLEQPRVAVQPVDGVGVTPCDGVRKVEHDVAAHEICGPEPV